MNVAWDTTVANFGLRDLREKNNVLSILLQIYQMSAKKNMIYILTSGVMSLTLTNG